MDASTRQKLLEWIGAIVAPASRIWPPTSYSLKHDAEESIGAYVSNDQFKGAMLAAGYEPAASTEYALNWQWRIKSRVPPRLRPPFGQRGFGGLKVAPEVLRRMLQRYDAERS